MHFTIISIFPEIISDGLFCSLAKKALKNGLWSYETINLKDFGITKHKSIDDEPYGGGNGMIIRPDVLGNAIEYACKNKNYDKILYPSPKGTLFKQYYAVEFAKLTNLLIICGRFEGVDQRVIDEYDIQEISIGDYVLSGGELAALVVMDACIRLIPGVLENSNTLNDESFSETSLMKGMLEYPLYTRPRIWKGIEVPEVLVSGNHQKVDEWRLSRSIETTKIKRPDIYSSIFKKDHDN